MTTPPRSTRHADIDRAGLIAAHDAYAADLYDYCLWAVADPVVAEDAVNSALLAASGEPGLLHLPKRLRPWLYAAARKECLRAAWWSDGPRLIGTLAGGEGDLAASQQARQRLSLVRQAAAQLGPLDQETAELALRHGLSPADLAAILGTSTTSTRAAIHRISAELSVACGDDARQMFSACRPAAAPAALYARVIAAVAVPEQVAYFAGRARPLGRSGLPRPLSPDRRPRAKVLAAVALSVTLLALGVYGLASEPAGNVALGPSPKPSGNVSLDIAPPRGRASSTPQPASPTTGRQDLPARTQPDAPTSRPARPPAPSPAASRAPLFGKRSLQSVNYPHRYVRQLKGVGRLDPVASSSTALTKQEATFKVVAGLANPNCYSFQDTGGRYLRHYGFRLRLHSDNGTPLFRQDATFCARPGPAAATISLEAYNYPGRFIRHRDFELWVDPADDTDGFRADSTFRAVTPWTP